jgi:aspartyl-tRNA(Asn)/glutamyl-tRNA(Gln) amidotransferase subunit B
MNSFSFLELAIEREIRRQIDLYTNHPNQSWEELIFPGTYRWDAASKELILMRRKESADDYRYFPEPDLIPLMLKQEYVDQLRDSLPELPHERYQRYTKPLGLTNYDASVLINDKPLSDYFEAALSLSSHPQLLCNWVTVEFTGRLKEMGKNLISSKIPPAHVAKLVQMIDEKRITGPIAKSVADEMVLNPSLDPEIIVDQNQDYHPMSDVSEIEPLVDQVLKDNIQSVEDYRAGREKAFAFLVGQVMKLTRGKASPQVVNDLLRNKISNF